jgi:hypothetical protein
MFRRMTTIASLAAAISLANPAFSQTPAATAPPANAAAASVTPINGSVQLAKTIDAHGGLQRWRDSGTLSYTLADFPLSEQVSRPHRQTLDLVTRANRVEHDNFAIVYDGRETFATQNKDFIGLPPRLFAKGSSYFVMMPFVFADGGITARDAGAVQFGGKSYNLVIINYAAGVGDVTDDYQLLIDPQTNRLAVINHTVHEAGIPRVTWTFDAWQEVNGLLLPEKLSFSPGWTPDAPPAGKQAHVRDMKVLRERPAASTFAPPAGSQRIE